MQPFKTYVDRVEFHYPRIYRQLLFKINVIHVVKI